MLVTMTGVNEIDSCPEDDDDFGVDSGDNDDPGVDDDDDDW